MDSNNGSKTEYEKGDNKYFFKMFRFVKPYAIPFAFGKFMHSSQGFAFPFILSLFAASIMAAIMDGSTHGVWMSIVLLVSVIFGFLLFMCVGIYVYNMAEQKAIRDLKKLLFRTYVNNSLENATAGHSGEGIASINTDADTASQVYGWPLSAFLIHLINIVFSSFVVFVVDWRLGLSAVAIGLLGFMFQHRFTGPISVINRKRLDVHAEAVKATSNIFSGAMAIRAYNMQEKAAKSSDKHMLEMQLLAYKEAFISTWQNLLSTTQNWMTLVAVFALGGWLVATGRLEFHLLMMAPLMAVGISDSLGSIGRAYADLQGPIAGAKRVFNILDNARVVPKTKMGREQQDTNGYTLNLKDFSFSYLDAETEALKNINLKIGENQMIALVGESGSGKSTLLRVLIGMYERDDLRMTLGDLKFNDSSTIGWRKNFAYVDQSCKLFDMSVKENIAMGKRGKAEENEIIAAAKRAAAHDFIEELEEGYSAPCGEKGSTLSGGQKQRIAIARALVKKAPILVFDEATSALDAESERYIMETINSLRTDHTVLITTHNLENIVTADKIVVLDGGKVAETGTHTELMAKAGRYHRLFTQKK